MAVEQEVRVAGANVPNPDLNGPQAAGSMHYMERYALERNKRVKTEGYNQYIDLLQSEKHKRFTEDPFIPSGTAINTPVPDGAHVQTLIVGAGWGGILTAVKLVQAGFKQEDLLIVDPAGGFGGTWWWNRYPGVMCDVESYIYLPLLEEMDYMPTRRYTSGYEIQKYADMICSKYGLHDRAMFQSGVLESVWDESKMEWVTKIARRPKGGEESQQTVRSDFVVFASGVLNSPKLADLPGIMDFNGHMFHTSRWDYDFTGGTPADPHLTGLKGKKVAIVGTGATAIQAIPHLANTAEKVYVFQRTPSAIDVRDNSDTNPVLWKKQVATGKGWWRARNDNFIAFLQDFPSKPKDLVNDGWTRMPSYSAVVGTPREVTLENMTQRIEDLHALDYPRQERIRQRVDEIVQDKTTAESLKAWYPGWCKRPCFHDEYLPTFNLPHVQLIDTNGNGLDRVTETSVVANGQQYPVDVVVWSTGFRSPVIGSPAGKADVRVKGRGGVDMEDLAASKDFRTLHGIVARQFPNMFYIGPFQSAVSANFTFTLDIMAEQTVYVLSTAMAKAAAMKGASTNGRTNGSHANGRETSASKVVIEPTHEAQEAWAMQIMHGSASRAALSGCTPSYLNKEGELDKLSQEEQIKLAAGGTWSRGFPSFLELLDGWRKDGGMEGLEVTCVP